jgi:glycosyltransferase involved in cell wall biosynthesis
MSRPFRIALVTHYPADPNRLFGGVQAVAARLVSALARRPGLEIHVIHCHSDVAESRVSEQAAPAGGSPVTAHFLAQTRQRIIPNMTTAIPRIARLLTELAPDAVHAQDSPGFALAALRAGLRPAWSIHGMTALEAQHYRSAFARLALRLTQYYERRALAAVPVITSASEYLRRIYGPHTRADWRVIGNPAPADYFALPRWPHAGRVLMPATLIPLKDPLTLVRAAAVVRQQIPHLDVRISGSQPDPVYETVVRAEIDQLGLQGVVIILGMLSDQTLRDEISEAEVVALPSRQEAAPMALIEAMAAGAPVLATTAGGIPDLVDDGVTGRLVPPADPASLAAALTAMLANRARTQQMGRQAQAIARARFDPDQVAAQFLALYREMQA